MTMVGKILCIFKFMGLKRPGTKTACCKKILIDRYITISTV